MNTFLQEKRCKKRVFYYLLFIAFICHFSTDLNAQTLKQISIEDGLPSLRVYNIFQDSLGFIWLATNNGVVKYDGYEFKSVDFKSINASNDVWEVYSDKKGRIWFSSEQLLVYIENDSLHSIPFPASLKSSLIHYHHIDDKGNHFLYFDSHLYQVVDKNNKIELVSVSFQNQPNARAMSFIKEDETGTFWYNKAEKHQLILCKSTDNKTLIDVDTLKVGNKTYTSSYIYHYPEQSSNGDYYAVTENHVCRLNTAEERIEITGILPEDILIKRAALKSKNISQLISNKGVFYLNKDFQLIPDLDFTANLPIKVAFEDRADNIWLCTFDQGLYFLNGANRAVKKITKDKEGTKTTGVFDIAKDHYGNVWFTNNTNKIWKLDHNNVAIPYDLSHFTGKPEEVIRYLSFDRQGNLYVSSSQNACIVFSSNTVKEGRFNAPTFLSGESKESFVLDFKKYPIYNLKVDAIKHISSTPNGEIVIGNPLSSIILEAIDETTVRQTTIKKGRNYAGTIWRNNLVVGKTNELVFMPLAKHIKKIPLELKQPIETLFIDQEDFLWIGTKNNGLYRYDGTTLQQLSTFSDLKLRISNIIEKDGHYWISTNKGLAKVRLEEEQPFAYDLKLFSEEHGLSASQVQKVTAVNNQLYVATPKGVDIIPLNKLNNPNPKRPLYFTGIALNGKDTLIHYDDYQENYLKLDYGINNIKLKFSCLPYIGKEYIHYEYRCLGIQNDWQILEENIKEFNINTLKQGPYTFEVRAMNVNGIVSDTIGLNFQILPPWWETWWAYILYIASISLVFILIARQIFKRKKIQAENQALAAINKAKTNFFTNITHELRTPLTMIMGLAQLEELKDNANTRPFSSDLKVHTKTMMHLINQLLDISKLEGGATEVYLEIGDLVQFCRNIVNLFSKNARLKRQNIHFYTNTNSLMTRFDAEKIERILYNIISNAIQYTQEGGTIDVILKIKNNNSEFEIEIADNGPGIEKELIDDIFNKFSHGNKAAQSSGIGLYLAKELAKFLGGDIDVRSGDRGSTFRVMLPLSEKKDDLNLTLNVYELPINGIQKRTNAIDFQFQQQESLPELLLVDDNPDILRLLSQMLIGKYRIAVANNGKEALNLALDTVPELIISDIMMPELDGFELCKRLKGNIKTSHIPIILLSAKDTKEALLKGTSLGADAYIKKPFDAVQLLGTIESLILNRKLMRDKYANLESVEKKEEKNAEDEFVLRLKSIVENNLSNLDLDVNTLCSAMYMSRTQLHNKLKYTTGMSARPFIRKIRLNKAKELLAQPRTKIASIAYEVGMEPKYFSKIFLKTLGESPSEYRKKIIWEADKIKNKKTS